MVTTKTFLTSYWTAKEDRAKLAIATPYKDWRIGMEDRPSASLKGKRILIDHYLQFV